MLDKRIKQLALKTRIAFYPFIRKHRDAFELDFCCACAVCSYTLTKVLKAEGFNAKFVIGEYVGLPHAFVVVDNHIVDITATQFGLDRVNVEDYPSNNYVVKYKLYSDLKKELSYWTKDQVPFTYKKEIDKIIKHVIQNKNL